ncbi:hypothetical protein NDU88_003686 [Pleurodeles waltl]|uniref:Secreted protein n=1 Tax=Pleurodeles waltl TaxID=8319 RepID=A0AAV7TQF0_PLEWA|nr:hypothetical protein NDU88_003686 [Pleurodeles waltl]
MIVCTSAVSAFFVPQEGQTASKGHDKVLPHVPQPSSYAIARRNQQLASKRFVVIPWPHFPLSMVSWHIVD